MARTVPPRPNSEGTGSPSPFLLPGNKEDKIPSVLVARWEPRTGPGGCHVRQARPGLATRRQAPCDPPPVSSSSGSAEATGASGRTTCRKEGHRSHPLCTRCALNERLTWLPKATEFQICATCREWHSGQFCGFTHDTLTGVRGMPAFVQGGVPRKNVRRLTHGAPALEELRGSWGRRPGAGRRIHPSECSGRDGCGLTGGKKTDWPGWWGWGWLPLPRGAPLP